MPPAAATLQISTGSRSHPSPVHIQHSPPHTETRPLCSPVLSWKGTAGWGHAQRVRKGAMLGTLLLGHGHEV